MINRDATLFDITESHPETIPVFVSNGFPHMADTVKREAFAKTISLRSALLLKQMDIEAYTRLLEEAVNRNQDSGDITLNQAVGDSNEENLKLAEIAGLELNASSITVRSPKFLTSKRCCTGSNRLAAWAI